MNRLAKALLITLVLQLSLIALVTLVTIFVPIDKPYLAEAFLDPQLLRRPEFVGPLTDDFLEAAAVTGLLILLLGAAMSKVWILLSHFMKIRKPGDAGRLVVYWGLLLILGIAGAIGVTWKVIGNDFGSVATPGLIKLAISGSVLFGISYYLVGTLWSTPRKLRPAVPFATLILASRSK